MHTQHSNTARERGADAAQMPTEIIACWATSEAETRAAQRLRHQVFVREMGAREALSGATQDACESDRFDPFCDHLLIKVVQPWEGAAGMVIGTTRVLRPAQARRAGGPSSLAPQRR